METPEELKLQKSKVGIVDCRVLVLADALSFPCCLRAVAGVWGYGAQAHVVGV